MSDHERILSILKDHLSRYADRAHAAFGNLESPDDLSAIADFLDRVPVTVPLVETMIRKAERSPVFNNLSQWLRFMEQHYVALLDSEVFTPRLNDIESIECVSGLVELHDYFPDRVFGIAEEKHLMLCTRALIGAQTEAKVNQTTGHEMDRYIALADYRWLDFFLERKDETAIICRVLDTIKLSRVAELEAIMDDPGIGSVLLEGAL